MFQLDVSQFNMIVTIRFFYGWSAGLAFRRPDWIVASDRRAKCVVRQSGSGRH
jgi:hypothetical protein